MPLVGDQDCVIRGPPATYPRPGAPVSRTRMCSSATCCGQDYEVLLRPPSRVEPKIRTSNQFSPRTIVVVGGAIVDRTDGLQPRDCAQQSVLILMRKQPTSALSLVGSRLENRIFTLRKSQSNSTLLRGSIVLNLHGRATAYSHVSGYVGTRYLR